MERAELGVDGDHAFALLGEDIQVGEVVFVKVENNDPWRTKDRAVAEKRAATKALNLLREKLGQTAPVLLHRREPPISLLEKAAMTHDEEIATLCAALDKAHELLAFIVRYEGKTTPEFVQGCRDWIDGEYTPCGHGKECDHIPMRSQLDSPVSCYLCGATLPSETST